MAEIQPDILVGYHHPFRQSRRTGRITNIRNVLCKISNIFKFEIAACAIFDQIVVSDGAALAVKNYDSFYERKFFFERIHLLGALSGTKYQFRTRHCQELFQFV
jgi:hypothetical protein